MTILWCARRSTQNGGTHMIVRQLLAQDVFGLCPHTLRACASTGAAPLRHEHRHLFRYRHLHRSHSRHSRSKRSGKPRSSVPCVTILENTSPILVPLDESCETCGVWNPLRMKYIVRRQHRRHGEFRGGRSNRGDALVGHPRRVRLQDCRGVLSQSFRPHKSLRCTGTGSNV